MIKKIESCNWSLDDLYLSPSDPQIEKDFLKIEEKIKSFLDKYEEKEEIILENLYDSVKDYESIEEMMAKIMSYAQLLYSSNNQDENITGFFQNISEKINHLSSKLIFFTLSINNIDQGKLEKKIATDHKINRYLPWIKNVRIFKPYELSLKEEQILHQKSLTSSQAWIRLFDETQSQLKFHLEEKTYNTNEIFDLLSDKDEKTREKAAKSIGLTFENNIKIFVLITNILAKDKQIEDKLRGFKLPISSRNLSNLVEDEIVDQLVKTVTANYRNISHRFYRIKANMLKKEKLEHWDRNAPFPEEDDEIISWEEAKNIVKTAYSSFLPEFGEIVQKFFDNNWIDAEVRTGKDSGAFSHSSVTSVHPYISMNYSGKIRDVMTLAHELGHGIHQYLSRDCGYLLADTALTLAETASVFGEQLTFRYLLERAQTQEKRQLLIANKINDMLNTVVRQISFCKFEQELHQKREEAELSAEDIGEIWLKYQKESLGEIFNFSKEYQYYWSYIPHFIHAPFYVYAYGFGDCLVNSLYKNFIEKGEGFKEKYLSMLKAGGSKNHKEMLAPFGLDASQADFWQKGLDLISELIDEIDTKTE